MKHVSDLLEKKLVDYVHIWNFSRNDRDFHWVKSLEDKENNIYVFSPANYGKYIRFPYLLYKLAYKLYSRQNFQYAKFIKVDDDIVFMDIAKGVFTDFIKQIEMIGHGSSHYMVSANVINNGVCAYYQQNRYNSIPEDIGKFAFPYDNSISGFAVQNYWNSGEKSEKLHHFFIQNREVFLGKLKTINPEKVEVKIGARFSTNFIGFKQQAILKYVSSGVADDEKYLTADLSKELGKHVQIFMPFVVSHLSYYSQGLQDDKALLDKYKMIK